MTPQLAVVTVVCCLAQALLAAWCIRDNLRSKRTTSQWQAMSQALSLDPGERAAAQAELQRGQQQ